MSKWKKVKVRTSDNKYLTIYESDLFKSEYFKNMAEIKDGTGLFCKHTYDEMRPIFDYLIMGYIDLDNFYITRGSYGKSSIEFDDNFYNKIDKLFDYYLIPKLYNKVLIYRVHIKVKRLKQKNEILKRINEQLKQKNEQLKQDNEKLKEKYEELKEKYEKLEQEYEN